MEFVVVIADSRVVNMRRSSSSSEQEWTDSGAQFSREVRSRGLHTRMRMMCFAAKFKV